MLKHVGEEIKKYTGYTLPPGIGKADKFFSILNISIPILMGILLFVNPLPFSAITEMCFYLSVSALIVLLIYKKTNFTLSSPLALPIALFFIWAAFGLAFALDISNSLHDLRAHLLKYIIIFYLLVNYFGSRKKMEILSWIIICSATIFCIGAVVDYYFIKGFPFIERMGVHTFRKKMLTDYIGFVTVFAMTLALGNLLRDKKTAARIFFLLSFLIMCAATFLTQSRGAIIGLFTSIIFLCFIDRKFLIVIVLAISIVLFSPGLRERFSFGNLAQNERMQINRLTVEVIKEHPLTGIGFGMQIYGNKNLVDLERLNSRLPARYQQGKIIISPHNTILDVAARTGILGAILFLYILFTAFSLLWKILRSPGDEYFRSWAIGLLASLTSFMIPALFADTTFGPQAVAFYTILAMITILWNLSRKEKKAL